MWIEYGCVVDRDIFEGNFCRDYDKISETFIFHVQLQKHLSSYNKTN